MRRALRLLTGLLFALALGAFIFNGPIHLYFRLGRLLTVTDKTGLSFWWPIQGPLLNGMQLVRKGGLSWDDLVRLVDSGTERGIRFLTVGWMPVIVIPALLSLGLSKKPRVKFRPRRRHRESAEESTASGTNLPPPA